MDLERRREYVTLIMVVLFLIIILSLGAYAYKLEQRYNECAVKFNDCSKRCPYLIQIGWENSANSIPSGGDFNGSIRS